jgi:hypothetical protein
MSCVASEALDAHSRDSLGHETRQILIHLKGRLIALLNLTVHSTQNDAIELRRTFGSQLTWQNGVGFQTLGHRGVDTIAAERRLTGGHLIREYPKSVDI